MKIETSIRGKWVTTPAFQFQDKTIVIQGTWIKIARVHDEAWLETELQAPESCLNECRKRRFGADLFTFAQMPPGRAADYPFHREFDSIAVIPLTDFDKWWMSLPQETRKNVRRAERCGVRIETKAWNDDLARDVVQLNNSSELRQGRRYTHFGKSFEQVKKDHASFLDRSEFLCAYIEGELVGYIKLVYRGRIASILNILTNEKHKDKRPANALIRAVVERCFQNQLTHLTYGFFNYGNKRDTTITQFKVRHGFEELLVPRYFVPLTVWGRVCLASGLYRGVLGVLPQSVLNTGVALRAKWYNLTKTVSPAGVAQ